MNNLIPHFIHEQCLAGQEQGRFNAVTLFIDISGFTPLTSTLMEHGKEGAEILNTILNVTFGPVVGAIYQQGGFVSGFAGDALTAVFPDTEAPLNAIYAAQASNTLFAEQGLQHTPYGDFALTIKAGLDVGTVHWGIVGSETHKTWFFRGDPVDGCTGAEHHCQQMEIVLTQRLLSTLTEPLQTTPIDDLHRKLTYTLQPEPDLPLNLSPTPLPEISSEVLGKFLPGAVIDYRQSGEFRQIASVFIAFREPEEFSDLSAFVGWLMELSRSSDGYMEMLDFGDKGATSLIVFGAPRTHENTIDRALHFITDLQREMGDRIRAGVTYGPVFAGINGGQERSVYVVLGQIVNLSARLMMAANWGEIWLDQAIAEGADFQTESLGEHPFKGFDRPLPVFKLSGQVATTRLNIYQQKMVGRKTELQQLQEFAARTQTADDCFPGVLTVYGSAGIGKSRLVYELRQYLRQTDTVKWCYLPCNNVRGGGFHPFKRFMFNTFRQSRELSREENLQRFEEKLSRLTEQLTALPESLQINLILKELKRTHSVLLAVLDMPEPGPLYDQMEPRLRYENTILALTNLFLAFSQIKPVVISIDDIQWIDDESLTLLERLTRQFYLDNRQDGRFPLALICSSRYHDDGTCPELKLDADIATQAIDLNVLNRKQIQDLAQAVAEAPLTETVIDFLATKTDGNPFYIEQILQDLQNRKALHPAENGALTVSAADMDTIPATINELLIARLDRLTLRVKELVQTAAVIGHEFEAVFLMGVMRRLNPEDTPAEVSIHLETARQVQIWESVTTIRYIFRHILFREAAYDMQPRARLRHLHRVVAEIIERLNPDDPKYYADLAHHYEKAKIEAKAIKYLEKAADHAKETRQNKEALGFYDHLLDSLPEPEKKNATAIKIWHKKGDILKLIGQWKDSETAYRQALSLAEHLPDQTLLAESKNSWGWLLQQKGDYPAALQLLEAALSLFTELDDRKGISKAVGNMGIVYDDKGDYERAMACYERSLNIAETLGDQPNIIIAVGNMGNIYYHKGDYERATACYERALSIAEILGDQYGISGAVGNMGGVYANQGDYDRAMACYERSLTIVETLGASRSISSVVTNMGIVYADKGDYDRAMACYERSLTIAETLGNQQVISIAVGKMGNVYYEKGDYDRAMACYERAIVGHRKIGFKFGLTYWLEGKARVLFDRKEFAAARTCAEECVDISAEISMGKNLFKGKVLLAKINFQLSGNTDQLAIVSLEQMLAETDPSTGSGTEEEQADLNYELRLMNDELGRVAPAEVHRKMALELYQKLWEKTSKFEYKERMEELS